MMGRVRLSMTTADIRVAARRIGMLPDLSVIQFHTAGARCGRLSVKRSKVSYPKKKHPYMIDARS